MAGVTTPEGEIDRTRTTRRRRILLLLGCFALVAVIVPPLININRYHRRIAESISRSIGRPVRMSSVRLHLLPRPGFEVSDFVVEEDPAFGFEPILRSADVTAYVRLVSLWRGRLEIARISFDEPSLNLVRNREGRWNFSSILTQASQNPNAPTAQRHTSQLPRFPYIEASNARVNFKSGDEKLPFSFLNADLSAWLDSPGEWRLRFEGQPVRTDLDLDLANTGVVRVDGSVRSAASLVEMPVVLHATWSNAALGQLTRILVGSDYDWRGDFDLTADVTGSARQAAVKIHAQGRRIHRVEFETLEPLNLDVTCQAQYTQPAFTFDPLTCLAPSADGHLLLTGSIKRIANHQRPALSLELNHIPVAAAVAAIRLVRSGFASGIEATGLINGRFDYAASSHLPPNLQGEAAVSDLAVTTSSGGNPLLLPELRFTTTGSVPARNRRIVGAGPDIGETALLLEPTAAVSGSLTVGGRFTRAGFSLHIAGHPAVEQLAALSRSTGFLRSPSLALGTVGAADLDLTIHGPWMTPLVDPDHFLAPFAVDGTLHLRNAQFTARFLSQPLDISTAQASFAGNQVVWSAASLSYGSIHGDGSLSYPLFCESAAGCTRHFNLRIASLDAAVLESAVLGGAGRGELLQQILARLSSRQPEWPSLSGTLQCATLNLDQLAIHDASASLSVAGDTALLESLSGRALDGLIHASGALRLINGTPHYTVQAQLDRASTPALAAIFHENWGPGAVDLATQLALQGFDFPVWPHRPKGRFTGSGREAAWRSILHRPLRC